MVTLVGSNFFNLLCAARFLQIQLGLQHTIRHGLGVALVRRCNLRGQHQVGLQVHHMFCLVSQVCATVLHLRDTAVGVGF